MTAVRRYKGMSNGADPHEYPPLEREQGAVSYITGLVCPRDGAADENGAYWDDGWCCCHCGRKIEDPH